MIWRRHVPDFCLQGRRSSKTVRPSKVSSSDSSKAFIPQNPFFADDDDDDDEDEASDVMGELLELLMPNENQRNKKLAQIITEVIFYPKV